MAGWRELIVWQKSHKLVLDIYTLITKFPSSEKFAICDQLKRSAYSVPSNIVEGHAKNSSKDFLRYLYISRGSLEELRYFVFLSFELNYINQKSYSNIEIKIEEISKLLNSFIKSIKIKEKNGTQ